MPSATPELLAESLTLLLYTLVAVVLTVGGLAAEYASVQHFGAGEQLVALWLAAIGVVMLYGGLYKLGYERVLLGIARTV
ncbi:hypothetical protein D8Y22_12070 [Salinadaptatus halalkaliphilus]|uniref:DUF8151 domain-containing protein n=1 Tax=Salinadaptatus halalkaliphilus TaxID=2419781 RepID=A0A4S3TPP4_9EURY|nr:hypothetical protein [Salinadaptatus halalkaliphilus]THE64558.1 hypothetical protein D8Y22_12070 [Salinadaptatus halalkaliphilus]